MIQRINETDKNKKKRSLNCDWKNAINLDFEYFFVRR